MNIGKGIGGGALLMVLSGSAVATDTLLYNGALTYPGLSARGDAAVQGVYLAGGAIDHAWEADFEHTSSTDPSAPEAGDDLTAVYTGYPAFGRAWRLGVHGTSSGGGAASLFAGLRGYGNYGPHWGVDLNLAHIAGAGVETGGIALQSGASVATASGYVDMKFLVRAGAVHSSTAPVVGSGALGIELNWRDGGGALALSAWRGSERYPLRNEGFVLYTDDDVRTGGVRVKYSYLGSHNRSFTLSWQQEGLQQADGSSGDQTTLLGMFGFSW